MQQSIIRYRTWPDQAAANTELYVRAGSTPNCTRGRLVAASAYATPQAGRRGDVPPPSFSPESPTPAPSWPPGSLRRVPGRHPGPLRPAPVQQTFTEVGIPTASSPSGSGPSRPPIFLPRASASRPKVARVRPRNWRRSRSRNLVPRSLRNPSMSGQTRPIPRSTGGACRRGPWPTSAARAKSSMTRATLAERLVRGHVPGVSLLALGVGARHYQHPGHVFGERPLCGRSTRRAPRRSCPGGPA